MLLSIIFLPLLSFIICACGGFLIGHYGAMIISCSLVAFACLLSYIAFYQIALNGVTKYVFLSKWIESGLFQCDCYNNIIISSSIFY